MSYEKDKELESQDEIEDKEWIESLEAVLESSGPDRVQELLRKLQIYSQKVGITVPYTANTPYINTIPVNEQPAYPGDKEIERRIRNVIRWNAMAMVVRANRHDDGIGGHISTYASCATLLEVAFNHFLKAKNEKQNGDIVYFQGHSSPGIYARAYLEGRLTIEQIRHYRKELTYKGGLSSYPHPWLMPDFWEYPTVSMGLSPIMSIYQARFNRYLEDRGLKEKLDSKVWVFMGDGETDEPESLGAITLASREHLDNLIFVINCNLQRLDGPVRGNGKIIQELERIFRGAGWNVIKVVWGHDWDQLLEKDEEGLLVERMESAVDGDYQKYVVEDGSYIRDHFFGTHPKLQELVKTYSDSELEKLRRGGHDSEKVYAAYKKAVEHTGSPTVILAKTIKGYGLGEAGEGRNVSHNQKKLNEEELKEFRTRFSIPISDDDVARAPFYRLDEDSPEIKYIKQQREKLGGYVPTRKVLGKPIKGFDIKIFDEFYEGSGDRPAATTMAYVRMLSKLLRDSEIGKLIVPIIPDEARSFGMESLFRQAGIYSHPGQVYEPVDSETFLYYKEAKDGQILEEGITEAGAFSSFIAAGTAYATHGVNTIPFFTFYSMFGFQRVGDLVWAGSDMKCKGFYIGCTSGRSSFAGEGLQHQDGNSHHYVFSYPTIMAYDPAYAYELAVIIKDGIKRMYMDYEDVFYYITLLNEIYEQPPMPKGVEEGIIKGMYCFKRNTGKDPKMHVNLFGSGGLLNQVMIASKILEEEYGVSTDVWSVTSYKELYKNAQDIERWNIINSDKKPKTNYIQECFDKDDGGIYVAVCDYIKAVPDTVSKWFPKHFVTLGTDGFGRSDNREMLRHHFEVDAEYIAYSSLVELYREGVVDKKVITKAKKQFKIDVKKPNPLFA
ncbi:MAG: pyruvate dehydrogenase (acetyl-transferring), homodimeric type [Thermodesulfobacteriota bacterium]